jgi:hypothetical protein
MGYRRTVTGRAVPVARGQLINPAGLLMAQRRGRWLAGRNGAPCRRGIVENESQYQVFLCVYALRRIASG